MRPGDDQPNNDWADCRIGFSALIESSEKVSAAV